MNPGCHLLLFAFTLPCASSLVSSTGPSHRVSTALATRVDDREFFEEFHFDGHSDSNRRAVFAYGGVAAATTIAMGWMVEPACAKERNSLLMMKPKKLSDESGIKTGTVDTSPTLLSSERCLLQLLPVKNVVFRTLEEYVAGLSSLRNQNVDSTMIKSAQVTLANAIEYLDTKRRSLEPIFDEEDSALFQIEKAERGERLIEGFRSELSVLLALSKVGRIDEILKRQKSALLALSDIGELLVGTFPYDVPTEGKFSFLPRLLGRCKVVFTFKRGNEIIGNVTILADGFAAPITAGNFVDLSLRGFYNGLAIKGIKKRFGGTTPSKPGFLPLESLGMEPEKDVNDPNLPSTVIPIQLLGSYREGFYDPLTAKPRRIPLEILRQDLSTGLSRLSYESGFSDLSDASLDPDQNSRPVLSFEIPGIVVFNHQERTLGSSEFFVLPDKADASQRKLLNGQYAPFGYIIGGYDVCQSLKDGDIIQSTTVSEFGSQNLVKIRGNTFSDVMQKGESDETM